MAVVLGQSCARIADSLQRAATPYPFPVLCDEDRDVIKRYGVWHPIGIDAFNIAHPASFLIAAPDRELLYAFVGSTQHERAPLTAILDAAGRAAHRRG